MRLEDVYPQIKTLFENEDVDSHAKDRVGTLSVNMKDASQGIMKVKGVDGLSGKDYYLSRLAMVMARADGGDSKVDMDSESCIGNFASVHPYTKTEHNMLKQALKTLPTNSEIIADFTPSKEQDDVFTKSPVASPARDFRDELTEGLFQKLADTFAGLNNDEYTFIENPHFGIRKVTKKVGKGEKYGFIDRNDKPIGKGIIYDFVGDFKKSDEHGGKLIAEVQIGKDKFYIDVKGEEIK